MEIRCSLRSFWIIKFFFFDPFGGRDEDRRSPRGSDPCLAIDGRSRARPENLNAAYLGRGPLNVLSQKLLGQACACHTETL